MTRRKLFVIAAGLVTLFVARNTLAQAMLGLVAPHHVHAPVGKMTDAFAARVDADAGATSTATAKDALRFALDETAAQFHFGLDHKTTLAYDGKEREGNCVEYADLFARIVNRESHDMHAYVVRSDAKLLGQRLGRPALKDHDWVLVVTKSERFYVDPTLYDMGLGWDVSSAVSGVVKES